MPTEALGSLAQGHAFEIHVAAARFIWTAQGLGENWDAAESRSREDIEAAASGPSPSFIMRKPMWPGSSPSAVVNGAAGMIIAALVSLIDCYLV